MTYVPINVSFIDQKIIVDVEEVAQEVAIDESLEGCWHCHTPLNPDTFGSECLGNVDVDLDID